MTAGMSLFVSGVPAPKGSRTLGRRRDGSTFLRPASNAEHRWTATVARAALARRAQLGGIEPPSGAPGYAVELAFAMPRPARPSHAHPSRTDLDKLVRAVLDGLVEGGLLLDDRHVVELAASKGWAPPGGEGVHVAITAPLEPAPAVGKGIGPGGAVPALGTAGNGAGGRAA